MFPCALSNAVDADFWTTRRTVGQREWPVVLCAIIPASQLVTYLAGAATNNLRQALNVPNNIVLALKDFPEIIPINILKYL